MILRQFDFFKSLDVTEGAELGIFILSLVLGSLFFVLGLKS
jgi:hypothetical protein